MASKGDGIMARQTIRTPRAREKFIAKLAECCNVSEACRAANIGRSAAYHWRSEDEDFAAAWAEAEETAADLLEQTAWNRATTDKSDRMLEILLKAHRPHKFIERIQNQHTGKDGVSLADEAVSAAERIRARLDKLAATE